MSIFFFGVVVVHVTEIVTIIIVIVCKCKENTFFFFVTCNAFLNGFVGVSLNFLFIAGVYVAYM